MDCSLPGFSVHGILQIRILKWIAISHTLVHSCNCLDPARILLKKKKLFIWLHLASVVAHGVEFPDQGLNPGPLHWEHGRVLSHWSTRSGLGLASSRGLWHVLLGEFSPQPEARGGNPRGFSKPPQKEARPSEGGTSRGKREGGRAAALGFIQAPVVRSESS